MKQPGRLWGSMCLLGALLLCPALAGAQQRGQAPGGNGLKVGEGRLHPFIELETRVDSGVGYFPPEGSANPDMDLALDAASELLLHVRPGLRLELPSSKLALAAQGYVSWVQYTGLLVDQSPVTSHVQALADVSAHINPDAPLSVVLANQFARADRTRTAALGVGVLSLFNELRASAPVRPGGGAIEITPEAIWTMEFFEPLGALSPVGCTGGVCDPQAVANFDYNNVRLGLDGRWRFLPKTALVLDTDFDLRSYFRGENPSAQLLRAMAGLAGLVSPKVTVTAKAGWAQNFGATGGGTFIAHLEGSYMFSPTLTLKGGYLRTLEPVSAYGLFRDDRGFLQGRALFMGKLAAHAALSYDRLSFMGPAPRQDSVVTVDVGPEYQFRPWLVGSAGYLLNLRTSSATGAGINYSRNEGYVRLSVAY